MRPNRRPCSFFDNLRRGRQKERVRITGCVIVHDNTTLRLPATPRSAYMSRRYVEGDRMSRQNSLQNFRENVD